MYMMHVCAAEAGEGKGMKGGGGWGAKEGGAGLGSEAGRDLGKTCGGGGRQGKVRDVNRTWAGWW